MDQNTFESEPNTLLTSSSLLIENIKLRKLLSLQQRAIAYRHSLNSHNSQDQNNNNIDEDDAVSSNILTGTLVQHDVVKICCLFCPKVFASPLNYSRHLSLKHLTATA